MPSNTPPPTLSVAICTSGRGSILVCTLDSVLPQTADLPAEVLVIDQLAEHPPEVTRKLTEWDQKKSIRWLRVETDSLTGKRNIALREATGDIVLFLDDDVILPPGCLCRHLKHYEEIPELAGLTGQVYHAQDPDNPPPIENPTLNSTPHFEERPETRDLRHETRDKVQGLRFKVQGEEAVGSVQCSRFGARERGQENNTPAKGGSASGGQHSTSNIQHSSAEASDSVTNQAPRTKHQEPLQLSTCNLQPATCNQSNITPVSSLKSQVSGLTPTRHFIGCNHSVRKKAAESIGGYDEQFIASSQCEDFDIADRLADAGYILGYDPNAWLIHLRARSGGTRGGVIWPEWTRTANIFLYLFRHARSHGNYGSLLWRALRTGPLRKEIVTSPLKCPGAWVAMLRGAIYGWQHRIFRQS